MTRIPTLAAALLAAATALPAAAQDDRYLGEIFYNGYNFCPRGTAATDGQLLAIAQNTALFSLLGTFYGGDGRTTFALPDLRGRAALQNGTGPGLVPVRIGERGGTQETVLTVANLAPHSHAVNANNLDGDRPGPGGKVLAAAPPSGAGSETIYSDQPATVTMNPLMIASTGVSEAVPVDDPYQAITFCIRLTGIYPSRS